MSQAEKAAKLAEMMQNAQESESLRDKRIDQYRREDELESSLSSNNNNSRSGRDYLDKVQRDAFIGQDKSLSERIRSKRFTVSRDE